MKKRIISILLSIVLVFCLSISVFALNTTIAGDYEIQLIDEGKHYAVYKYKGNDVEVTIPDFYNSIYFSSILSFAFTSADDYCKDTEKITMGNSIRLINSFAFDELPKLKEVYLTSSVQTINEYAFSECPNFEKIVINDSIKSIDKNAFYRCDKLTIYCNKGSYGETFAKENNIPCVLLDEPVKTTYLVGDTDGNDDVDILDATLIQKLIAHLITDKDGKMAERGSYDNSGQLIILDATKIQRSLVELPGAELIGTEREYKK